VRRLPAGHVQGLPPALDQVCPGIPIPRVSKPSQPRGTMVRRAVPASEFAILQAICYPNLASSRPLSSPACPIK
jgi:hypothetical protein